MRILAFINRRDWNRPSKELAIELIYAANGYRPRIDKVTFGIPEVLDQRPDIDDDPNTFVPAAIDIVYDGRFEESGRNGFLYRRLPIGIIGQPTGPAVRPPSLPFKAYDVLDQINAQLGLQLTEDDILDTEFTSETGPYVLTMNPKSLVWLDGIEINVAPIGPQEDLFSVTSLDGFKIYDSSL